MSKILITAFFLILACLNVKAQMPDIIGTSEKFGDTIITHAFLRNNKMGTFYKKLKLGDTVVSFFSEKKTIAVIRKIDSTTLKQFFSVDSSDTTYNYLKDDIGISYYSISINPQQLAQKIWHPGLTFQYKSYYKFKSMKPINLVPKYKIGELNLKTIDQAVTSGNFAFILTKSTEITPQKILLLSRNRKPKMIYEYSEESPW